MGIGDSLLIIVALLVLALLWVTMYDSRRLVVREERFVDARIRKSVRAVVLADLHNRRFGRKNERLLALIEAQKPDVILIAGDLLTAKPEEKPDAALELLRELASRYPVYYGIGNHEHRLKLYPEDYGDAGVRYEAAARKAGARFLINEHTALRVQAEGSGKTERASEAANAAKEAAAKKPKETAESLPEMDSGVDLYGVQIDKKYYKRFGVQQMKASYLERTLKHPDPERFTVLLAHNPDYFPQYAEWGADLTLSGHVHGGIVRLPFPARARDGSEKRKWRMNGLLSPNVRFFPEYDGGRFTREGKSMIVSRGVGTHTLPIRAFNPGEVILVKLVPEDGEGNAIPAASVRGGKREA